MKKFGMAVFGAVLFGLIGGWLFGDIGLFIGVILGAASGYKGAKDEELKEANERIQLQAINRPSKKVQNDIRPDISSTYDSRRSAKPETAATHIKGEEQSADSRSFVYGEIVPELIAACIVADGQVPEAQIDMATNLIENDDLLKDTRAALNALDVHINEFLDAYSKSNAIFKLKTTKLLHRLVDIKSSLHADRINVILDAMADVTDDTPNDSATHSFINRARERLKRPDRHVFFARRNRGELRPTRGHNEISGINSFGAARRHLAERLIEEHGDPVAKQTLNKMRQNPTQYAAHLKHGARTNNILRLALAVGAGLVAGSALANAFQQTGGDAQVALGALLDQADEKLVEIGGVDNVTVDYLEDQASMSEVGEDDASVGGENEPEWEQASEGGDMQEHGLAEDSSSEDAVTELESNEEGSAGGAESDLEEIGEESDEPGWDDDFEF